MNGAIWLEPLVRSTLVLCTAAWLASLVSCQTHKTAGAVPSGVIPTPVRRGSMDYEVDGHAVFDATFEAAERFSEGLAAVNRGCHFEGMTECRGGKWGYIDLAGHQVVPFLYDAVREFTDGRAWVVTTTGSGYIDRTGRVVVPLRFPRLGDFHDDRAMASLTVEPKLKWGYVDPSGAEVIPYRYDEARDFEHGRAIVKLGNVRGVIDTQGREVLPFIYQHVLPEVDQYTIGVGGLWGLADLNGKVLVPPHYADIRPMREGVAAVRVGDKLLGYVDATDAIVIPPRFDNAGAFYEGLADVEMNGKWGYIDHTGAVVIPCRYDYVRAFKNGVAEVSEAGKVAGIDRSGAGVARAAGPP